VKAGLYLRVSTKQQDTGSQERELREVAKRLGHEIVEVYEDQGISGAKGRDKRPAFDRLHKDITSRKIDIVMAWSVDRLGRSLQDLMHFLEHMHSKQVGLYLHQQGLDTTTPAGKAMFQMCGVFAEFERAIIRERVRAGMARAKEKGKRLGRKPIPDHLRLAIRASYARGDGGYRVIAKQHGVAVMTVRKCLAN
jgi:DNA invertase Pin-like site-specific DNA recombinase